MKTNNITLSIRPGNYAHEKWVEKSYSINTLKNRLCNKYYVPLYGKDRVYIRVVCLTKAQSILHNQIMTCESYLKNGYLDIETLSKFDNAQTSLVPMIKKGVFSLRDNKIWPMKK